MNVIEFLCLFNRFANKSITANNLYKELLNIDTSNFDKDTLFEFNKIKDDIKKLMDEYPIIEDDYIKSASEANKFLIEKLNEFNDKNNKLTKKEFNCLNKENNPERDSIDRFNVIYDYIKNNSFINNIIDNLSDIELLQIITRNFSAVKLFDISKEKFDDLVKLAISKDMKEALFRLANNFTNYDNYDLNPIINYYIKIKDSWYISELISSTYYLDKLDLKKIFNSIDDKDLILELLYNDNCYFRDDIDKEDLDILKRKEKEIVNE